MARASGGMFTSCRTETTATTNDPTMAAHAIPPDSALVRRRATLAFTRKPMKGRSGISSSISTRLPLQHRERVWVERFTMTEQCDNDRQTDRGLSRRDRNDEKDDDLSVCGAKRTAECHERKVHRVEHD